MTTGYRGGGATLELRSMTLEQRVARLEAELEERQRKAAERRMMLQFVGCSELVGVAVALLVYVVGRLA